jgi:outer membrane protein OmpA-like peptidoglycan-associated protein
MLALAAAAFPAAAFAQASTSDFMAMSVGALEDEIGQRYNSALTLTRDGAAIAADDPRYLWASQAKAQCGIALGFLKSSTKDPVSIGKCADAALRMNQQRVAEALPPPPPAANPACSEPIAGIVFFEWDSAVVPDSALPTIQATAQNLAACGWRGVSVAGHTDRSGGDSYNDALARRRAEAVAQLMTSQGTAAGVVEVSSYGEKSPKVPTADGERNPQNRRVEITVKN